MSHGVATGSLSAPQPLDMTQQEAIPLDSRILHKFFEPIILLVALVDAVKHTAKRPPPEPNIDVKDPKQLFFAFANKLGHVCDRERGGDTVTSFVILKNERNPEQAQYVFAANRQTNSQLQTTAAYVESLLRTVKQAPEGQANQHDTRSSLLYHILRFNRPRVSVYLRDLRSQAALCLEKCQPNGTEEDNLIAEELKRILVSPSAGSGLKDPEADYLHKSETTIQLLVRIDKSRAGAAIMSRALEDRIAGFSSMECWSKFFHTMRRILAYLQSTQFFLLAKERWPSLFQNVTVSFLSSSRPIAKPIRNKSLSADGIVNRMTRKEKEIQIFKTFVQTLQAFSLDDRIKEEYGRATFRPTVHSEVLLLNWVSSQGEVMPSRFFNGWMYIGSSKPTCKLCDYYFHEHRTNVEHRASHGNLYPSWRVPDVFPYQGKASIDARQIMVDRVLLRVRRDAFDIVRKKALPSIKGNDTNTFTAWVTLEDSWSLRRLETDVDDITSMMGEANIG
ncbi:hypothetical protein V8C37DRAFT_413850 [Trichoderma ceciliae]